MQARRDTLILLFVFILILPGLFWGLPSAITPQVDAPVPLSSLLFVAEYGKAQLNTVYPVFHYLFLLPFFAAVAGCFWVAGEISRVTSVWPYGFRDPSLFFSSLIFMTNLVSAFMAIGLLWATRRVASLRPVWSWVGLLVVGTNGVFIYYSRVGNLDLPYTFWWSIALCFLWRYFFADSRPGTTLIPAAVAAAAAAGTKDQASSFAIGAGVLIVLMSQDHPTPAGARFRNAVLFTLSLLASYALLAILPHPAHWWAHARFVVGPHAPTDIPLTAIGELQLLGVFLHYLMAVYTLPVLAVAGVGAVWLVRRGESRHLWFFLAPMIAYYVIVIAKTRVVYPRFMVPFVIPVFALVTYGAAMIADSLGATGRKLWLCSIGGFVIYQVVFSYFPVTYMQALDLKRVVGAELPRYVPPGQPLLISRMQSYNFPNRQVYERYRLMMLSNDPIVPPSRHSASILHPLDPNVAYYLLGSGTAGLPWHVPEQYPELPGEKIHEWRYPGWVKAHVLVPVIYEFTLYRRTGPLPVSAKP